MRVVFIASAGRSGSTILDRLLGSTPDVWSGGELARVWGVVDEPGRLCACGQTPRQCEFWSAVLRETFGAEAVFPVARIDRLFRRFHPGVAFAAMLSPLHP